MGSPIAQSKSGQRLRGLQSGQVGQVEAQGVEAHGHQGLLRRREFHAQTAQIRALHSTDGAALHESARDPSGTEGHILFAHNWRQKEPELVSIHLVGRDDQRYHYRGEHQRTRPGDTGRQSGLGQVRTGDEQPGK